jgi:hypothetical protein
VPAGNPADRCQRASVRRRRYFVGDDELIVTENGTYAFTNQWGNRTLQAIDLLKEAFPDTAISYEKSP